MNTSLFPEFLSYIKENDLIIKKSMSFYIIVKILLI